MPRPPGDPVDSPIDKKVILQLFEISKHLHKEYVKIKIEAQKRFEELAAIMKQV